MATRHRRHAPRGAARPPRGLGALGIARAHGDRVDRCPICFYDYYGFPPSTYELEWPAPGAPQLAARTRELLGAAGFESAANPTRGFDHGVFIPLKLSYPDARIPTVQLSLRASLDAREHLAMGAALAPLREEGVLIVGSGMSYHNMRTFNTRPARAYLTACSTCAWREAVVKSPSQRTAALEAWQHAPSARESHPREEHLLPLMVAAGAAGDDTGRRVFKDEVMGAVVSAFQFG